MSHLVVRARPRWQAVLIRVGAVGLAAVTAWGIYEWGRYQGGFHYLESKAFVSNLEGQLADLDQDTMQLREQNAILARGSRIDREAYKQLEGTVNGLQGEIMELKRELDFYRGIISPSDASRGLEIQHFELRSQGEGLYQYSLVLTQVLDNSNVVQGTVEIRVDGTESDEFKEYVLAQLGDGNGELAFHYRYFQSFEGELRLPNGFVPKQVHLDIKPRGKTYKPFSQSYDWGVREN